MKRSLTFLALAAALASPAAKAPAADFEPPRIVVTGEGEAAAKPDLAIISLSVMREAKTARAALDANNDAMAAIIAAMQAAGVAERDLQTAGFQITPRYNYANRPDGTQTAELAAYQVTNTLSVRVRELQKLGEILDRAVTLGVNQGGDISFINDDPSDLLAKARRRAVADAMAKAKILSEAAGVGLGRVLEISDHSLAVPPIPLQAKTMQLEAADSVPIQPGENEYRVQVTMTIELKG